MLDERYQEYHRTGSTWMRPHVPGEDMTGVSVDKSDLDKLDSPGGFVAADPNDPDSQWYVSAEWVAKNYILAQNEVETGTTDSQMED